MTIEERAEESANNATIHKLSDSWYIHRNGYIKGATEQEEITRKEVIKEACEWLRNQYYDTDYAYLDDDMVGSLEAHLKECYESK